MSEAPLVLQVAEAPFAEEDEDLFEEDDDLFGEDMELGGADFLVETFGELARCPPRHEAAAEEDDLKNFGV